MAREMKDSGIAWIGEIPREWGMGKIGFFADFYNGDRTSRYPQPSEFVDSGVPFINSTNINGDYLDTTDCKYITHEKYNSLSGAKLKTGDIVFCLRGSVGKCALNRHLTEGTVASSLATIRPTGIDEKYLLYCLLSDIADKQTDLSMNGTCAANLSAENVSKYVLPVPSRIEQRRIADFLDAECARIDAVIEKTRASIEEYKKLKQSVITQAVTKGIRPNRKMKDSGIEWIGEIPEEWSVQRIKYLRNSEPDSFQDGDWIESPYITNEGIRYLTTGNVGDGVFKCQGDGYITEETFNELNCKFAYPNDLVISRLNAPYGRACILPSDEERYVLAVDLVILRTDNDKRFLCYLMQCEGYQNVVQDGAKGTTMKRISRTNLGNVCLPVAPLPEQRHIADFLDEKCLYVDGLMEQKERLIEDLESYKKSLIFEYVTGKKEVPVA